MTGGPSEERSVASESVEEFVLLCEGGVPKVKTGKETYLCEKTVGKFDIRRLVDYDH